MMRFLQKIFFKIRGSLMFYSLLRVHSASVSLKSSTWVSRVNELTSTQRDKRFEIILLLNYERLFCGMDLLKFFYAVSSSYFIFSFLNVKNHQKFKNHQNDHFGGYSFFNKGRVKIHGLTGPEIFFRGQIFRHKLEISVDFNFNFNTFMFINIWYRFYMLWWYRIFWTTFQPTKYFGRQNLSRIIFFRWTKFSPPCKRGVNKIIQREQILGIETKFRFFFYSLNLFSLDYRAQREHRDLIRKNVLVLY